MMEIMRSNLSVNKDELMRVTAKVFGFLKVGSQIDSVAKHCIDELIAKNMLVENEGKIVLV